VRFRAPLPPTSSTCLRCCRRSRAHQAQYLGLCLRLGRAGPECFLNSVGLMGDFRTGNMLARDGKTLMTDNGTLCSGMAGSRHRAQPLPYCSSPSAPERLHLAFSQADQSAPSSSRGVFWTALPPARQGVGGRCVFDVLATGDLDMAVGVPTTNKLAGQTEGEEYEE
jgi:hypothetical protein